MSNVDQNSWASFYEHCPEDCSLFRQNWYDAWSKQNSEVIYANFTDQNNQCTVFPYFIKNLALLILHRLQGIIFPEKGCHIVGSVMN